MFRKIALCAMLVLFLAPATVMAAGQQGQAQGIDTGAGNCQDVQHQMATGTMAQEKYQNGESQGNALQNGDTDMLRNHSCDQDCEKDKDMARNMTRDQIRLNSESGPAGERQGAGLNGDAEMLQDRSCDQDCDQDKDMARNMTRDQIRLDADAVQQQDGSADQVQNRSGTSKGNGQDILAGFTEFLGAQFRFMGGLFQAQGQ